MRTSLHSPSSASSPATSSSSSLWGRMVFWAVRATQEVWLLISAAMLIIVAIILSSHDVADPGFSTSGMRGQEVHNLAGIPGAWLADMIFYLLGYSAWLIWLTCLLIWIRTAWNWGHQMVPHQGLSTKEESVLSKVRFYVGITLLSGASCALEWSRAHRWETHLPGPSGGVLGYMLGSWGQEILGFLGLALITLALGLLGWAWALGFSWDRVVIALGESLERLWYGITRSRQRVEDTRIGQQAAQEREVVVSHLKHDEMVSHLPPLVVQPQAPPSPAITTRMARERQHALFDDPATSRLPHIDLLDPIKPQERAVTPEMVEMTSRLIEKKLKDFGVEVRVVAASPGPVITRYEIEPATGVKGSQILNLSKDLARSLSLVSIRVIETIPGKNCMALELPNNRRQSIGLAEILGSDIFNQTKSLLTLGLGKDITGNPVVADLARMPHCLVAGTTGSGKSVGINAMILSLLYKASPQEVRLLLIDPKMLEMSVYEGIAHLIAPVVTDMRQAANGLNWCVAEMEKRYKLMSKLGVRNVSGYNQKIAHAKAEGSPLGNPFSLTPESPEPLEPLPFIVVVIDELADLMMVVGKKIEELIARLAQKARAAGIHLILATQRPSVDVITGLIKANVPTRISFQVSSKIDSRTILDQMGAEALLGMGDMLYMASGTGLPVRVHGAFVSDDEVHRVVSSLKASSEPNYIEGVLEGVSNEEGVSLGLPGFAPDGANLSGQGEADPMYDQAVAVVLKNRKASISLVQRHLKIGYNRAARLLEDMENAGLVSSMSGAGQREILAPPPAE